MGSGGGVDNAEARAAEILLELEATLRTPLAEALEVIARTAARARRSGRRARPIPQASFDAVLELIEALARGALPAADRTPLDVADLIGEHVIAEWPAEPGLL